MKFLLTAINSRYNQTNLAVRSIKRYVEKRCPQAQIEFEEFTINQSKGDILRKIYEKKPNVILFSVYIWNVEMTMELIREARKLFPFAVFGVGGPEVSYRAREILAQNDSVNFVICGEGEKTVLELVQKSFEPCPEEKILPVAPIIAFLSKSASCDGVASRRDRPFVPRTPFSNLDEIPFAYTDEELASCADTKIFYYESSRGCPFKCSYCLSSIEKSVRYRNLDLVFSEMQKFLDANVKLVKFVDRTFNLDENRTISIWNYIKNNHNGKTMFHFEIAAQTLTPKMLEALRDYPAGMIQFEIGVQSTNPETLEEIGRDADFDAIARNVSQIPRTIHSHLDLIAGLPYEGLLQFSKSFDDVMKLKPDMLQLGFLKVLSGTKMEEYVKKQNFLPLDEIYGRKYQYLSVPPYEVFQTPEMCYDDFLLLKDVEKTLDIFYNSGNFTKTMEALCFIFSKGKETAVPFFEFFGGVARHFRGNGFFDSEIRQGEYFGLLWNYLREQKDGVLARNIDLLYDTIRFDFVSMQKTSSFPEWYKHRYSKDAHHAALVNHTDMHSTRESYAHSEYEKFDYDMDTFERVSGSTGDGVAYLFLYDSVKSKTKNRKYIKLS